MCKDVHHNGHEEGTLGVSIKLVGAHGCPPKVMWRFVLKLLKINLR